MRILLVSQMYPGPDDPDLGTFVAQVERALVERGHEVIASGDGEARHAENLRDVRLVPAVVQLFCYDLRPAAEDDVDSGKQRTSLVFT